ncbi:MAG: excinuclease ABC subunit C [Bacteroidales bacterium]|nr:excinuclease ABC subunit C [Bacteroidales bacterium]MBO7256793.1 excinuclease ABC subunit C [Bacteroidales bacterium]MBQ1280214.1 excinuclease ABC subunit C [Bacteroidales bacterium]
MAVSDKLKMLPHSPGVYRFKDSEGTIIYVGKAKDLKNRVSQYFHSSATKNRKTTVMVSKIADIEHTVVSSEEDAFLLENNLIKEYQPRYNILLKDGKTYPWICLKNEPFPRVVITRQYQKDGSKYFGPYSSSSHAHALLELINSLYRLRNCKLSLNTEAIAQGKFKVCLNYHISKCNAPCIGNISQQEYMEQISAVTDILKGNSSALIRKFDSKMRECASALEFEKAQVYKEKKELLEKHYAKSMIVSPTLSDLDVFHIVFDGADAFGAFLRVNNGCIVKSISMEIKCKIEEEQSAVLSRFISGVYDKLSEFGTDSPPEEVLVPFYPDGVISLQHLKVTIPTKGERFALMELARKNAAAMKFEKLKHEEIVSPEDHANRVMENLKKDLGMDKLPYHIECFDNSNIQGTNPVASCVVFKNGAPSKRDYRHFNIKTVIGANDFASMKEVVNRRYTRLLAEGEPLPDLVVIDGGKGQVHSAFEALMELGLLDRIKLIGIAKRMEEIIVPGDPYPLFIDKNSTSLRLIMHLRDEAHRFGITHHRNRRSVSQLQSELDTIPGVGAVSREKLLAKYKTISRMKKVPYREIVNVIGKRSADALFSYWGLDKF